MSLNETPDGMVSYFNPNYQRIEQIIFTLEGIGFRLAIAGLSYAIAECLRQTPVATILTCVGFFAAGKLTKKYISSPEFKNLALKNPENPRHSYTIV